MSGSEEEKRHEKQHEKQHEIDDQHHSNRPEFARVLSRNTPVSDPSGLPRLNYNLWDHKTKLLTVTALLVLELSLLPIILFYTLWFATNLQHGICK